MKYIGDLTITRSNAAKFAGLVEVTGNLYVSADFQAPVLTSVGSNLYVSADFQAPVLTSVGGYLYVRADFQAPVLLSIKGERLSKPARLVLALEYPVTITDAFMQIGCQRHAHHDWDAFTDSEISDMDRDALKFWKKNKSELMVMCEEHARVAV